MKRKNNDKVWLFSFSDLAFLLLLAFTQASTLGKNVKIGEIDLPIVDKKTEIARLTPSNDIVYQVKVCKPSDMPDKPFQLVKVDGEKIEEGIFLTKEMLKEQLFALKTMGIQRPVLIPDRFSLSKDTVTGISVLQQLWQNSDKVVVKQQ